VAKRAIRDDEIAARALGCNVFAFKVVVFGITSAFAGLAGVLLFYYNQIASTSVYGLDASLKIFAMTYSAGSAISPGQFSVLRCCSCYSRCSKRSCALIPAKRF
jgi:ABC-type branched-subunit amino acid transport system permease subunit